MVENLNPNFDKVQEEEKKFPRYIDEKKNQNNIRILNLNTNGFRKKEIVKVDQMIEFCKRMMIDIALFSKTNTRWTTQNIDRLEKKLKEVHQNNKIYMSCSKVNINERSDYLLGSTMSITWGRIRNYLIQGSKYEDLFRFLICLRSKIILRLY